MRLVDPQLHFRTTRKWASPCGCRSTRNSAPGPGASPGPEFRALRTPRLASIRGSGPKAPRHSRSSAVRWPKCGAERSNWCRPVAGPAACASCGFAGPVRLASRTGSRGVGQPDPGCPDPPPPSPALQPPRNAIRLIARRFAAKATVRGSHDTARNGPARIDWKSSARTRPLRAGDEPNATVNGFAFDCGHNDSRRRVPMMAISRFDRCLVALKGVTGGAVRLCRRSPVLPRLRSQPGFTLANRRGVLDYGAREHFTLALATLTSRLRRRSLSAFPIHRPTRPTWAKRRATGAHTFDLRAMETMSFPAWRSRAATPSDLRPRSRPMPSRRAIWYSAARTLGDVIEAPWRASRPLLDLYLAPNAPRRSLMRASVRHGVGVRPRHRGAICAQPLPREREGIVGGSRPSLRLSEKPSAAHFHSLWPCLSFTTGRSILQCSRDSLDAATLTYSTLVRRSCFRFTARTFASAGFAVARRGWRGRTRDPA